MCLSAVTRIGSVCWQLLAACICCTSPLIYINNDQIKRHTRYKNQVYLRLFFQEDQCHPVQNLLI